MATKTKAAPIEVTLDTSQQIRLRNRDLIDFQKVTGKRFLGAMKELEAAQDDPDWTILTALLWIVARRQNPDFTYDDALDADLDEQSLMSVFAMLADPTEPANTTAS